MEQGPQNPQNPDAARTYEGTSEEYPPSYTEQPYAPGYPGAPEAGPYGPPPPGGPYGYPYGYSYAPVRRPTNTLAILALVFAFVCAPAAIVMGAIARRQIRRTGEEGAGLATAGLIVGIVFTVFSVIWIVVVIVLFVHASNQIGQSQGSLGTSVFAARAFLGI